MRIASKLRAVPTAGFDDREDALGSFVDRGAGDDPVRRRLLLVHTDGPHDAAAAEALARLHELRHRHAGLFNTPGLLVEDCDVGQPEPRAACVIGAEGLERCLAACDAAFDALLHPAAAAVSRSS